MLEQILKSVTFTGVGVWLLCLIGVGIFVILHDLMYEVRYCRENLAWRWDVENRWGIDKHAWLREEMEARRLAKQVAATGKGPGRS